MDLRFLKGSWMAKSPALLSTGAPGLDTILRGGLAPNRLYLIEGDPGAGKTTLSLQFLLEGVKRGESCMFVTLSESAEELHASAASHDWILDGIHVIEITAPEETLRPEARNTMFHPSEIELAETTKIVLAEAARIKPARLVFDSLSELRLLAENPLRYRRQILALKQHFSKQQCTVWFIDDRTGQERDMHLHSLAHGVISLERTPVEYGSLRRQVMVGKMRGHAFSEGRHDMGIRRNGVNVYPRLVALEHRMKFTRDTIKSGLASLDALLGGGLAKGTSNLLMGPAGTGKSSLSTQFVMSAVARGENAVIYLFDEGCETFIERSMGLGMNVQPLLDAGRLELRQIDPAELSPGEFTYEVSRAVEENKARIVVIDSLSGYLQAVPSERYMTLYLHELLTYLAQQGVTTLLLLTQHGIAGETLEASIDASYLSDTIILLRYFEVFGEIRQAISVVKKRTGKHERTIRELRFNNGITVGEPLRDFQGVLDGAPRFVGKLPAMENDGR
jgi:circadian clock protein KaiC